ncbi:MAG TPA: hypothetical protein P5257_09915 [Bacteroidales bacterium]|nr:hypothetical protein [Bacteroidales bacterium]HRR94195.1 hypothetical protein [Bacteroidales bacterium]HRT90420.1 hypothetical protein [Bacteroidales bacterium]
MRNFLRNNLLTVSFTLAGAIAGFLYWKFIGCLSGTCFIKSVWYMSTLYGMAAGYVAGSLLTDLVRSFRKEKKA